MVGICARMELAIDIKTLDNLSPLPCGRGWLSRASTTRPIWLSTSEWLLLFRRGRRHQRVVDRRRFAVWRLVLVGHPRQLLARFLRLALPVPHAGIQPAACQKLHVSPALGNAALIEHDDFVGRNDRRKPVGNHKRGAIARDPFQRILDFAFSMTV